MVRGKIQVSAGFYLMLALMILLMPLRWLFAAVFAGFFHELCHYIAIRLLCKNAPDVRLYSYSARMPLPEMSRGRELVCALAGPAGGCVLMLLCPIFPRLALCALVQTAYNLLPIYPLDGGRAVSCILSMALPPPKAASAVRWIGICFRSALLLLGLYAWYFLDLGVTPFLLALLMWIRTK